MRTPCRSVTPVLAHPTMPVVQTRHAIDAQTPRNRLVPTAGRVGPSLPVWGRQLRRRYRPLRGTAMPQPFYYQVEQSYCRDGQWVRQTVGLHQHLDDAGADRDDLAHLLPAGTYLAIRPIAPIDERKGDDYFALAVALMRAQSAMRRTTGGAA